MSARTKARKRALDLLYSAELRGQTLNEALAAERVRARTEPDRKASFEYAAEVVQGVEEHQATIDELIASFANGWTIARMPKVDVAILRVGAWEVLYNDEVPNPVAISEAGKLAAELSTEDSSRFINGVLNAIAAGA